MFNERGMFRETARKSVTGGFTFLEIIVVMTLLSVTLFVVLPKLTIRLIEKEDPVVRLLNNVLSEALNDAKLKKEPVEIKFILGSSNFTLMKERYQLPDGIEIVRARINDREAEGLQFAVRVYPDGICDYFDFTLTDKRQLLSKPLLCKVEVRSQ